MTRLDASFEHVASTPIAVPTGESGPLVTAPAGPVRGVWRRIVSAPDRRGDAPRFERSAAFYGIPYAEAPSGERRFLAPVPRAPWTAERPALTPSATPQRGSIFDDPAIPEPSVPGDDFLTLNIFTPAPGRTGARLPVLVWIHGGGWSSGSHNSPWYDGAAFNRDGVVTVSIAYRLGFDGYGWVDGSDATFNRAVLDQVLALEWVRDNIAFFGGDPGEVTIGGQSAGGGNVMVLMTCPRARGLFRRAISDSGAVTDFPADAVRSTAREMARLAGVEPNLEGWRALDYDRVFAVTAELEKRRAEQSPPVPLAQRIRAALVSAPDAGIVYGPVVDGRIVPLPVVEALARGEGGDIPLLAMSTTHEFIGAAFELVEELGLDKELGGRTAVEVMEEAGLGAGPAADYVAAHPELGGGEHLYLGALISDAMFHIPLLGWARARERAGSAGTWLSRFAWEPPATGLSTHCLDLPFAFDCLAHPYCDHTLRAVPPQSLADAVHGDWTRFILTGDPGWRPWDSRGDSRGSGRIYGDPRGARPDGAVDGGAFAVEQRLLEAGERPA